MTAEYHYTSELTVFFVFFITGFFHPKILSVLFVSIQIGICKTRLNPNSSYMFNNVGLYKTTITTMTYEPSPIAL